MRTWDEVGEAAEAASELLLKRLGPPRIGVVLGSGFAPLAEALGCGPAVPLLEIPGAPPSGVRGHGGGVAAARRESGTAWVFLGRWHAYEGLGMAEVVWPVRVLGAAGAGGIVLTCAAGGLADHDRPGDFAVVADHLNLMGEDPLRAIPPERRDPPFLELSEVYDPRWRGAIVEAFTAQRLSIREGILAALPGPAYETPAEVRMLRHQGADLVSMSTVPEAIAARYQGLRVAAVTCISNRGAGLGPRDALLCHDAVQNTVREAVARAPGAWSAAVDGVVESASG